jgi:two-component system, chemotaxis family, chemotaxis protein CheY
VPKALVVDDSRLMRVILVKSLQELGFEVSEAGNGQEAIDCLEKGPEFKIVLCDWNMPVMNGLDLVRSVRSNERFQSVSICMVTTENDVVQLDQALEAGANGYVMKPFTKEAIQQKVRSLGVVS